MEAGRFEEALEYGTQAILISSSDQISIISNMAMALSASCKKKDLEKAIELVDLNMELMDLFAAPGKVTYFHKIKTMMLIMKAWWQSCLGDEKAMENSVSMAYKMACEFDAANAKNELSQSLRFYFSKKKVYSYDSTGANAVTGIETMFKDDKRIVTAKTGKYMKPVMDAWFRIKESQT